MRLVYTLILFFSFHLTWSQEGETLYKHKKIATNKQTRLDTVSLNPYFFKVLDSKNQILQDSVYFVDYENAIISFNSQKIDSDSVSVSYLRYPDFITRNYKQLDSSVIVNSTGKLDRLYRLSESNINPRESLLDGLNTSGSLSRGVSIGNNQNSVLNSGLDLQLSGKLNDKVTLRASIQDTNIPLQQSGYSQRLDEFDQVFVEVFTDSWSLRAGDIDLIDNNSYFTKFSKRVQGLLVTTKIKNKKHEINSFASGALVRGQFTRSQFTAKEGNQGPYKLKGPNNELFIMVISGSESVYVNGIPLLRGATNDYIIDYNAGEIIFNPTFPINSEMRIIVDYQYSERSYTRFIGYAGGVFKSKKFKLGLSFFNENDLKNQSLQQTLSNDQVNILSLAGDDLSLMTSPSAVPQEFSENRILYKKEFINGQQIFVFSNDPNDELYQVNFLLVGDLQGDYLLTNSNSISNIYEYVPPIGGQKQGNYSPIVQLNPPEMLRVAVLNGSYEPSDRTKLDFDFSSSQNDLNLFSKLSDNDNDGFATRFKLSKTLVDSLGSWSINLISNLDYINKDFRTIERLYNPEFNRDWNIGISTTNGSINELNNQLLNVNELIFSSSDFGQINYLYEHVNFYENFNGNRHILKTNLKSGLFNLESNTSVLNTSASDAKSIFLRSNTRLKCEGKKIWGGIHHSMESNKKKLISLDQLDPLISQQFSSYEGFVGIGDLSKVFLKLGYIYRTNDSVQSYQMQQVNRSDNYYLDSKLIQSNNTDLSLFFNYRFFKTLSENTAQKSINSRLYYKQNLFKNLLQLQTVYETSSGQLPQQDFTYVLVEPSQGYFTWFDYNENGIQELEEFEVAQFADQAEYIRILLPNQIFINTHQNKFSQSIVIDPLVLKNLDSAKKKFWSHFYNVTNYAIDRKDRNNFQRINLNPFISDPINQLALNSNFRNQLFFNRGKQRYTMSYSYFDTQQTNILSFGAVGQTGRGHQFNFTHKIQNQWLINLQTNFEKNSNKSDNFISKNYLLKQFLINPKVSYLLDNNKQFDLFYQFIEKSNLIQNLENLEQHRLGVSAVFTQNQKAAINIEFNYFSNQFKGTQNTPVSYQMMEGLQIGNNYTWSLIMQKRLTKYLDLNINYFGRKSDISRTIHTGTVQLKAYF